MKNTLLLLLFFCFACKGQKEMLKKEPPNKNNDLTLLIEDNYSGLNTAENIIIRDQKTLDSFFSKINRTRKPGIPVPKTNFSEEVLIIVCEGEHVQSKSTGLVVLKETEKAIELQIVKQTTKSDSNALVSPFKVYKFPLSKKEIVFKK
ncbi:hypothetical protein [uncultured Maribacter sp.]|uniref:hypothetical protein n=1 Tax=uncultured Maribacter sp. TaxID=431308 RepID=UPI002632483D|nr:hypothetical protein [uncultured Maribacter sp.]